MSSDTTGTSNIARYLPEMARLRPNDVAVVAGNGRDQRGKVVYQKLTFADLERESDAYARGLRGYGIADGAKVLLMVRPGPELIALTFALFKVGCVPILIDPAMGRRNLSVCIAECAPDAMIGVPLAHVARLLFPNAFRTVKKYVTVGRRLLWGGITLNQLRVEHGPSVSITPTQPDTLAAIAFTTGSTGVPKGVAYEHGMLNAQIATLTNFYGVGLGEVDLTAFPLFGLFNVAFGVTSSIPDMDVTRPAAVDPAKIVELIRDQRVTTTFGSPAIWNRVSRYCLDKNITLPTLRRVLMAGAPVPTYIHERFIHILTPPADTYTPYGATEALPVTSISGHEVIAAHAARRSVTDGTCVGRPVPGITLRIITIDDAPIEQWDENLVLPANTVGEIVVKGPAVSKQYYNRPQSTRLAKIREGDAIWHRMGDVGYLDDEGKLWFYGRKTQRVQLADRCLFTEPCELVFNQHPDVFRSALVGSRGGGHQGSLGGHAVLPVIVVEPEGGKMPKTEAERSRFIAELRALGAAHEMTQPITIFLFHPAFPVDIRHNAKIFREQLATWTQRQLR